MDKKEFLKNKANFIRDSIIKVAVRNGAGHIAPSLSSVDMLTALYYECMSYDPKNPAWKDRDRMVFSKAHGCYALYAILADLGIIPKKEWENFYTRDSALLGCMERRLEFGLEAGCGSLGHGLPIAVGLAYGAQKQNKKYYTYCVIGDGELQEGTTWEALRFAVKHEVRNLLIIIDRNRLQAMDFITNILDKDEEDNTGRLKGFGLSPISCDGHDILKLAACIKKAASQAGDRPKVIIAETVKGYGLKCMENVPKFHFRLPTEEELAKGRTYEPYS